jgi:hypothetical protein
MSMDAAQLSRSPFSRLALIYAVSIPLAWTFTPEGLPWYVVGAGLATALSAFSRLPRWWIAINAVFLPALAWGLTLDISPLWAAGALAALCAVYGGIWKTRVPLFFSSGHTQKALTELLPEGALEFLDVGCGDGRVLTRLAAERPESRFEGVEKALVPSLLAQLRCWLSAGRCAVQRRDLWTMSLGTYDVVYAYLSPAVMGRFWEKARKEMRPGSMLVSAFAVPGKRPDRWIDVDDTMQTRLHVWRMGPRRSAA